MREKRESISISEASQLAGLSEKTIRRKIKSGELKAELGTDGKYAIMVKDIRKLSRQRSTQYELTGRIAELEEIQAEQGRQIELLEQRLQALEDRSEARETVQPSPRQTARQYTPGRGEPGHPGATRRIPASLPDGSMPLDKFCREHNLAPRTLNDHARQGIIDVTDIGDQPRGQARYYLTPEQQARLKQQRGL